MMLKIISFIIKMKQKITLLPMLINYIFNINVHRKINMGKKKIQRTENGYFSLYIIASIFKMSRCDFLKILINEHYIILDELGNEKLTFKAIILGAKYQCLDNNPKQCWIIFPDYFVGHPISLTLKKNLKKLK
jgi:hypothetical protein